MAQARRTTDIYIGAMLTLFLLWPKEYVAITGFRFWLFLALTGAWLVGLCLCLVRHRAPVGRFDLWDLALLGYGGLTALSALVNGAPLLGSSRWEGPVSILLYCLIGFFARRFARPRPWMLHLLGASMTVWCAIALLQLGGGNPLALYPAGLTWQDAGIRYSGAYISTTGNTDLAGALLCLCIPALAGGLLLLKSRRRLWLALPLGLCLWVAARMEVRGALLGLLAGGLFALPVLLPVSDKLRQNLHRMAALALLCGLVLVWCVRLPGTLGEAYDLLHGRADLYTGAGRVYIWQRCLELLPQNPLLGTGPDLLGSTGLWFERYDPQQNVTHRARIDVAHNEFLNVAVQQGIPALVCFLLLCILPFARKSPGTAPRICRAALLCWGVQACFGFSMINTAPYFWLALALAMAPQTLPSD